MILAHQNIQQNSIERTPLLQSLYLHPQDRRLLQEYWIGQVLYSLDWALNEYVMLFITPVDANSWPACRISPGSLLMQCFNIRFTKSPITKNALSNKFYNVSLFRSPHLNIVK